MSHSIKLTVSDAIYDAMVKQAYTDGQSGEVRYVARVAIKRWLSKSGHPAEELDLSDTDYRELKK